MKRIPSVAFLFIFSFAILSNGISSNGWEELSGINVSPIWNGIPSIQEDDDPHMIQISGIGGKYEGYEIDDLMIWNQILMNWSSFNKTSIFNASIIMIENEYHVKVTPLLDKFGYEEILLNISYNNTYDEIILDIEVEPVNDPPQLFFPTTSPPRTFFQYSNYSSQPIVIDPDPDDIHVLDINFNHSIEGKQSIIDQLNFYNPIFGEDWEFDTSNGRFTWLLEDQNIWNNGSQMLDEVKIEFTFWVSDLAGATDSFSYSRSFFDLNDAPGDPSTIYVQSEPLIVNEEISLWTDLVHDPDEDQVTYNWDFGDGTIGNSVSVNHSYLKKGWKTVQLSITDGEIVSKKIHLRIEILEKPEEYEPWEEKGDGPAPTDSLSFYGILTICIVCLILVLTGVIAFIFIRKDRRFNK